MLKKCLTNFSHRYCWLNKGGFLKCLVFTYLFIFLTQPEIFLTHHCSSCESPMKLFSAGSRLQGAIKPAPLSGVTAVLWSLQSHRQPAHHYHSYTPWKRASQSSGTTDRQGASRTKTGRRPREGADWRPIGKACPRAAALAHSTQVSCGQPWPTHLANEAGPIDTARGRAVCEGPLTVHLWGFSPVCRRMCTTSMYCALKGFCSRVQACQRHTNSFFSPWMCSLLMCCREQTHGSEPDPDLVCADHPLSPQTTTHYVQTTNPTRPHLYAKPRLLVSYH